MNPWPFVAAAYAVAIAATALLLAWGWVTMRRAEAKADSLKRPGSLGTSGCSWSSWRPRR
jgi:hypothetical protein